MGAYMIGYQSMYPVEFTAKEKKELNKHLDDVETLLTTKNLAKFISEEEDANGKYISKLNNLIPTFTSELDSRGVEEEDMEEFIKEFLDIIPEGRAFIKNPFVEGRDVSSRRYTILGREFESVFAGEMCWGDEPDGGGYSTLKALDYVNLLGVIESMTLPKLQSIHFIKEDDDEP